MCSPSPSPRPVQRPSYRIYLSPHLDDVVLSCGGAISEQARAGARVLVVSFFAGSPPEDAASPHAAELKVRWGNAANPVASRRAEDQSALAVLGAQWLHLDFLDCVYRSSSGKSSYPLRDDIFGPVHPSEASFHVELLAAFSDRVGELVGRDVRRARLYAPLGAGHHVDHVVVRRMALYWASRERSVFSALGQVRFYEDYPYAGDVGAVELARAQASEEAMTIAVMPRPPAWAEKTVAFGEEALEAKGRAVGCYASQISTFWRDGEEMTEALRAQALRVGGGRYAERYWQAKAETRTEVMGL